jgi:hypothetical protein
VLTQALLTMYVSMREKLAAAAGDNERAPSFGASRGRPWLPSFEIDSWRVRSLAGGKIALTLKTAERRRNFVLRLAADPLPARDLCASLSQPQPSGLHIRSQPSNH